MMKFYQHKFSSEKGFTIVELVLVIGLMALLTTVLAPFVETGFKNYDKVASRRAVLSEARLAFDRIVKEVRLIESSSDVIDANSSSSFEFEYPNGTSITYSLSGTDLLRNSDVLAENVSSLSFDYLDASGSSTTTEADVRRVEISMTFDAEGDHGDLTLRTQVFLRNTGNNYGSFSLQ